MAMSAPTVVTPGFVATVVIPGPQGDQGVPGGPGSPGVATVGPPGPINVIAIGSVTTTTYDQPAAASLSGNAPNQKLNLVIPSGQPGNTGTGSGNVVGPNGATKGHIAAFADPTGTTLQDGGALGDAAFKNTGTTTGTLAAGDDARILNAVTPAILATATASIPVNTQNLLYQGLLIAALRNVPTGLVDGILDPFSSVADINTAASSGYTFSASAGTIGATVATGAAQQNASYAIASSSQGGYPATNAFDGNVSSTWDSGETGTGISGISYIGQDFGSGVTKAISFATIQQSTTAAGQITSALLQYADAPAGAWTTIATIALSGSTQASTSIGANVGAHRCWRWLANGNLSGGSGWNVVEVTFSLAGTVSAMTLQSASLASAIASPSAMRALLQVDPTSVAFTANTDLIVALARDGATFTAGTLSLVQAMPDGTSIYDTGWLSVAGQPTGNSTMTYKITTPTQKAIVLTGVAMQVRP